jgi:hypothetical protein
LHRQISAGGHFPAAFGATMEGAAPPTTSATQTPSAPAKTQADRPSKYTKAVVCIATLRLAAAPDAAQGSLLMLGSKRNKFTVDDGTFLPLRWHRMRQKNRSRPTFEQAGR